MLIRLTAQTRVNLPADTIVNVSADEAFRLKALGFGVECEPETPAASNMVDTGNEAPADKPKRATKKKKA